jgi:prophage regulatory protein
MTHLDLPPRLLRLPAVLDRTGLGRDTVYRLIRRGTFPAPYKISDRASAWKESEISSWIEARAAERGAA